MQPARHLDVPMRASPADLESIALNLTIGIGKNGLKSILAHRAHNNRLPAEWDAKLLVLSRRALGRNLEPEERRNIRRRFLTLVETAANTS